jgi:hypothetical protein
MSSPAQALVASIVRHSVLIAMVIMNQVNQPIKTKRIEISITLLF